MGQVVGAAALAGAGGELLLQLLRGHHLLPEDGTLDEDKLLHK